MTIRNEGGFIGADDPRIKLMGSLMNQSNTRSQVFSSLFFLALVSMSIMSTGCSTMTSLTNQSLPVDGSAVAANANGTYSVEMHPNFGSPKQYKGVLTGGTTVSEALSKSGAVKKFRSMDVEILRIVEHKGRNRGLRMPVNYQGQTGPDPSQDYALLDGDRIVVKPKESSSIVKMIGSVVGMN